MEGIEKIWISITFLALLYSVKLLSDFKRFYDDPACSSFSEKLQDSKSAYLIAVPLSYMYCLAGAYDEWIENLFCADLIFLFLICLGVVILAILISIQNRANNGVANNLSDMSGAIFFISNVTESSIYLVVYAIAFVITWLFYIVKCEKEDNYILRKVIVLGVETILIVPSFFSDKMFAFRFVDNMLYYSILMFLSETLIPPISNKITTILYDRYKTDE